MADVPQTYKDLLEHRLMARFKELYGNRTVIRELHDELVDITNQEIAKLVEEAKEFGANLATPNIEIALRQDEFDPTMLHISVHGEAL